MSKKQHDQSAYEAWEGFREGVKKYAYHYEFRGKTLQLFGSDLNYNQEVGHFYNHPTGYLKIRRIQEKWVYGTLCYLIHLEKVL